MIYSNARLTICCTHPEKPFARRDGSVSYLRAEGRKDAPRRHVPVLYQKGKMTDRELNNKEPYVTSLLRAAKVGNQVGNQNTRDGN